MGLPAIQRNVGKDITEGVFCPQHPDGMEEFLETFHIGWVRKRKLQDSPTIATAGAAVAAAGATIATA